MAENKKGFILYANWWFWLEDLTIEQKAEWVDWLFNYVNDKNPEMPKDQTLKIVCKMTKAQLKEDLEKWKDIREKRVEAGKKGGLATQSKNKQNEANALNAQPIQAVNDNVNVNVNVKDIEEKDILFKNTEKEKINNLTNLIQDLEQLMGRCLTNAEFITIKDLSNIYPNDKIYKDIQLYKTKVKEPIFYMKRCVENARVNPTQPKDNAKDELTETLLNDEWLQGFYERQRQDEEQRKKDLRNED